MKKSIFVLISLLLCLALAAGCSQNTDRGASGNLVETKPTNDGTTGSTAADNSGYTGDWCLSVAQDGELYRMTALNTYYGATGIRIDEYKDNHVKGSIYSISGAPSYRQATVTFEGDVTGGKLTTSYADEDWIYSGVIELTFEPDAIEANITRETSSEAALWGIPEGAFTFVRPIETKAVALSDEEKTNLAAFFSPVTEDTIQPFAQDALDDPMMIEFIGLNLGLGNLDTAEFGADVTSGVDVVFSESVMNSLCARYFGTQVKKPQSTATVAYANGSYTVPALGGIAPYPTVQMLLQDQQTEGRYYAIIDYMLETPEQPLHVEYQRLFTLQKTDSGYTISAIADVASPIDFDALNALG